MPSTYVPTSMSATKLHILGNFLLILSAWLANGGKVRLWMVLLCVLGYSLLIEYSQHLTISRLADSQDMLANITGLTLGYLVARILESGIDKIKSGEDAS